MLAKQIENGIPLATARKLTSNQQNGVSAKVQSLAYFENALARRRCPEREEAAERGRQLKTSYDQKRKR
jgi:hypothetical protein